MSKKTPIRNYRHVNDACPNVLYVIFFIINDLFVNDHTTFLYLEISLLIDIKSLFLFSPISYSKYKIIDCRAEKYL